MEDSSKRELSGTKSASAEAYYEQAQDYKKQGNAVMAVAMLTKSIAEDGTFGNAYYERAQTLMQMGDLKGAKADADKLESRWPDNFEVIMLQARIAYNINDLESAIHYYNIAIEINPNVEEAYRERGKARLELGDSVGAADDAKRVAELSPDKLNNVSGKFSADGVE